MAKNDMKDLGLVFVALAALPSLTNAINRGGGSSSAPSLPPPQTAPPSDGGLANPAIINPPGEPSIPLDLPGEGIGVVTPAFELMFLNRVGSRFYFTVRSPESPSPWAGLDFELGEPSMYYIEVWQGTQLLRRLPADHIVENGGHDSGEGWIGKIKVDGYPIQIAVRPMN